MDITCEYCGTAFSNDYNLIVHKRTAKYCLALRGDKKVVHVCENCGKSFTIIPNLRRHQNACRQYISPKLQERFDAYEVIVFEKDQEMIQASGEIEALTLQNEVMTLEIDELKLQIEKLEAKTLEIGELKIKLLHLEDENATLKTTTAIVTAEKAIYKENFDYFKARPTTNTTNNTTIKKLNMVNTSTIEPFTIDLVKQRIDEYTYEEFMTGEIGIKKFILGLIIKDDEKNYVTTDTSRPNFHRYFRQSVDHNKKWVGDKGALFLNHVFTEIKPKMTEHWNRLTANIKNLGTVEEFELDDEEREHVKPVVLAITGDETSSHRNEFRSPSDHRKELLGSIIKYIRPYISV